MANKEKCEKWLNNNCTFSSKQVCKSPLGKCQYDLNFLQKFYYRLKQAANLLFTPFCIGIILIFLGCAIKFDFKVEAWKDVVFNILITFGATLAIAALINSLIDIPSRIREFQNIIINAYASEDFFNKMSEEKLIDLRKLITVKLHLKNIPKMPDGLIKLDQDISEYLHEPYFSWFRQRIVCKGTNEKGVHDDNLINKIIEKDFEVISPYNDKNRPVDIDLTLRKLMYITKKNNNTGEGTQNMLNKVEQQNAIKLKKFEVSIDGSDYYDISGLLKIYSFIITHESSVYDRTVILGCKNAKTITIEDIKSCIKNTDEVEFEFKENEEYRKQCPALKIQFFQILRIRYEYMFNIPESDNCFTNRMRHPVQNFSLDYRIENLDMQLYGQIIGTRLKDSDISLHIGNNGKSLTLETFEWLLPQNGVFVVMGKK